MRDFDRDLRVMRSITIAVFAIVGLLFVAMISAYGWIGYQILHANPEYVAAAAGRAVKAFNDASH